MTTGGFVICDGCWYGMSEPNEGEAQSQDVELHCVIGR